jgi:uncharacterized repeat protein (TIGR03803 family)
MVKQNMKTILSRLGLILGVMALPSLGRSAPNSLPFALYAFSNMFDGSQPSAGLTLGSDGNFYGTCSKGGAGDFGSVFKITPGGALTPLHSFSFIDGYQPTASLAQGTDGNFYGTTSAGGTNYEYGTVFQISSNGAFNWSYSFTGGVDGANPQAGLVQAGNGGFYGTTLGGGTNGDGAIFEISSTGTLFPIYSFTREVGGANLDGANPYAALTLAGDGSFYGTTYEGGINGQGTVFHLSSTGTLTPLHSFASASDGANPAGQLVQWTNGVLYGTASAGGEGFGTVFTITPGGVFSNLYSFTNGIDGAAPSAGLALGPDGNFYGATSSGGPSGGGGLYKITPQGALTPLYLFTGGNDGSNCVAMLALGKDGDFYGTTQFGGSHGDGVVFKINPSSSAPTLTSITQSAGAIDLTWSGLPGQVYQAQYATNLTQTIWSNLGGQVLATNGLGSQTDSAPSHPDRFYRVYLVP